VGKKVVALKGKKVKDGFLEEWALIPK